MRPALPPPQRQWRALALHPTWAGARPMASTQKVVEHLARGLLFPARRSQPLDLHLLLKLVSLHCSQMFVEMHQPGDQFGTDVGGVAGEHR